VLISFAYLARNEYEIIRWPEMVVNKSGTRARSRRITAGENQVVLFNKGAEVQTMRSPAGCPSMFCHNKR